jgi:hypothetical protein
LSQTGFVDSGNVHNIPLSITIPWSYLQTNWS